MSLKMSLFAGAALLTGLALSQMPSAVAADAPVKMPTQEQRAIDNSQPALIETRISELHDKLKITAAQEGKWKDVAEAMRETAKEVRTKLTDRAEKVKTVSLTAVDELKSYQDLQQVQYDGVKRLVEPFEDLYNSMSPEQKKNADEVFEQPRERAQASGGTTHRSVK